MIRPLHRRRTIIVRSDARTITRHVSAFPVTVTIYGPTGRNHGNGECLSLEVGAGGAFALRHRRAGSGAGVEVLVTGCAFVGLDA